jgi:hypothetical protein
MYDGVYDFVKLYGFLIKERTSLEYGDLIFTISDPPKKDKVGQRILNWDSSRFIRSENLASEPFDAICINSSCQRRHVKNQEFSFCQKGAKGGILVAEGYAEVAAGYKRQGAIRKTTLDFEAATERFTLVQR